MKETIERDGYLSQQTAVGEIALRFGKEFTYINTNGRPAIRKDVLAKFRRITADAIVWNRAERVWRKLN